jgi:RimJ/RimL family protein N-acetyltransferase
MMQDVFETSRLRLRPLAKKDAALFCALYSDTETMRFITRPMSKAQTLASFEVTLQTRETARGPTFFTIVEKNRNAAIGLCSIQAPELRERRAEIGLMLVREACRRGFGVECVRALIDAAFEALPIDTVWVQYRPANAAAERLFDGLDFLPITGTTPRTARRMHSIRAMQRFAWQERPQPTHQGEYDVEHDQFS